MSSYFAGALFGFGVPRRHSCQEGTAKSAALALRRRLAQTPPATLLELLRQIFFVQRASNGELRVNDVGDVKVSRLTKQFEGFVPLEAVILHQPVDHVGAGEPQGVDQRSCAAD